MNNFAELGKEHEDEFNNKRKESLKKNIWSSLGTFRYVGDIFDVYVPKFIKFLVGLSGGEMKDDPKLRSDPASGRGMILGSGIERGEKPEQAGGPAAGETESKDN